MKILFVCTGNVFRSLTAEYTLNEYAKNNNLLISASSAGTIATPQRVHPATIESLRSLGINVNHEQRKISKQLISNNDLIIAMGLDHQAFIKEEFGIKAPLFNELCYNKKESVKDIHEALPGADINSEEATSYIRKTVNYIHESIPLLVKSF